MGDLGEVQLLSIASTRVCIRIVFFFIGITIIKEMVDIVPFGLLLTRTNSLVIILVYTGALLDSGRSAIVGGFSPTKHINDKVVKDTSCFLAGLLLFLHLSCEIILVEGYSACAVVASVAMTSAMLCCLRIVRGDVKCQRTHPTAVGRFHVIDTITGLLQDRSWLGGIDCVLIFIFDADSVLRVATAVAFLIEVMQMNLI